MTGTLLGFLRSEPPRKVSPRTLTFAERVSYQRAIEKVYWRHRIWPNKRHDQKPSLDAVISHTQLEKKVADYLRKSQALEDYWRRPITAEQLQAEMDRMAQHTKLPEVLTELFDALGNDPFIIAECLARPALADRLLTNWYSYDQKIHGQLKQRAEADIQGHPTVEQMRQLRGKYNEIELIRSNSARETDDRAVGSSVKLNRPKWDETVQKLATLFSDHSVATGVSPTKSAAITQIRTGVLSALREHETSYYATAVITKTENRLKIARVTWLKEPLESWLAGSENQVSGLTLAVTTGYTLPAIITGGCSDDTWTNMYAVLAGRTGHTAVWTGSEMIIWGGADAGTAYDTGGRYNPNTDTWAATSMTNAPDGRWLQTAVWTGTEMIVWGGQDANATDLNSGGKYNPNTDSWTATSTDNAPQARHSQTAVWTGSEMIIWGGCFGNGCTPLNTGGRYGSWRWRAQGQRQW
jgi:hypothetical protein